MFRADPRGVTIRNGVAVSRTMSAELPSERQPMKADSAAGISSATSGSANTPVAGDTRAQGTALRAWPN
jgi:hypothetical protein